MGEVYAKTGATNVERLTIPETVLPHSEVSSVAAEEANMPQDMTFQLQEWVKKNTDSSSTVTFKEMRIKRKEDKNTSSSSTVPNKEMRIQRKEEKIGNKIEAGNRGNGTNGNACSKWFELLSQWVSTVRPATMPCQQARVLFSVLQILALDLHRRSKKIVSGHDFVTSAGLGWVSAAHTSLLSLCDMHRKHEETDSCYSRSLYADFGSVTRSVAVLGIATLLGYALKGSVRRSMMTSSSRSRLVIRMVLLAITGVCARRAYGKVSMTSELQKDFLCWSFLECSCSRHVISPRRNCSLCQGLFSSALLPLGPQNFQRLEKLIPK